MTFVEEMATAHTPESLAERLAGERWLTLLRSALYDAQQARYSLLTARPLLVFRSFGSRCEVNGRTQFGNPWRTLESLMARFELLEEIDLPFPLGGCFGFWGYDLKNFVEPRLPRRAVDNLELPECQCGFYDSLVVFDHQLGKTWIVSTGLQPDGSRDEGRAREQLEFWRGHLREGGEGEGNAEGRVEEAVGAREWASTLTREEFLRAVERALRYIRAGDIYQVNLAHRLTTLIGEGAWSFFERLCARSPSPFAAFLDCGEFQICSSSPESFLRISGSEIRTRPIKGTRPRSADPTRDAQLSYELQTSAKEMAELVMITDLLRNDLGKVCEYGSVHVPEMARLEKYPQVQHLVSTVTGRLREFSGRKRDGSAEDPGDGNHRRVGAGHARAVHGSDRISGFQPGESTEYRDPNGDLRGWAGAFSRGRGYRGGFGAGGGI
jgi:para-aminobenzoate synthetase component 1